MQNLVVNVALSFALIFFAACCKFAIAATLPISVQSVEGLPVKNAVVVLTPEQGLTEQEKQSFNANSPAIMNQINKQFVPHVLVIQSGMQVAFPNSDNLFHHVYSFSETKQFELKLYKEFSGSPIRFEKAGIADLGCNIHDWMLGFIYVTDSPYFVKTDESGQGSIDAPAGRYYVNVWHPRLAQPLPNDSLHVVLPTEQTYTIQFTQPLTPSFNEAEGFQDYP